MAVGHKIGVFLRSSQSLDLNPIRTNPMHVYKNIQVLKMFSNAVSNFVRHYRIKLSVVILFDREIIAIVWGANNSETS